MKVLRGDGMYRILIVDDERREREGIELLIHRFQYPLEIVQAQNGEEALAIFEKENIDILLTDIKMPFMTGIELIEQVRKKGYTPFCIIFSAYGEFEYAQNAISLGVIQYLLKPIRIDEFKSLFTKVCQLCEEKQKRAEEKVNELKETENKRKVESFRSFLLYLENDKAQEENIEIFEENMIQKKYRMVMLSSYSFLFSVHWKEFEFDLREMLGEESWIINIDDLQVLLMVSVNDKESDKYIKECCEKIIQVSKEKYQFDVFMVISPVCDTLNALKNEYGKLRETMDYQFFVTESSYILYDKEYMNRKQSDMLPIYFSKILTYTKLKNYDGIIMEFDNVFQYIDKNVGFSSIYIKYSFTDILKKICENLKCEKCLLEVAEEIYEAKTLENLKQVTEQFIERLRSQDSEEGTDNRLVYMAKKIVSERYQDVSLGVSTIADELHVTLAYLSALFKMETGQTLVKYITYYRMEQAKCLLETSNMKVADVAEKVGYLNTSYFISLFRNREGCSPQQYREKKFYDEEA